MANHKSSLKRIRSSNKRRIENRYQLKTARTLIKKLRKTEDKQEVVNGFAKVTSMIDKLAKTNVIHKNKASNHKSKLQKKINSLK